MLVQNFFLLIPQLHQFGNLLVDELLLDELLFLKPLGFLSLFEMVESIFLSGILLDSLFLLLLFDGNLLLYLE